MDNNDKMISWRPYAHKYRVYSRDDFNIDRIYEYETLQQFKSKLRRSVSFSGQIPLTSKNNKATPHNKVNDNAEVSSSSPQDQEKKEINVQSVTSEPVTKPTDRDYTTIFIPWGPQWYSRQILNHLLFRDKRQWYESLSFSFISLSLCVPPLFPYIQCTL